MAPRTHPLAAPPIPAPTRAPTPAPDDAHPQLRTAARRRGVAGGTGGIGAEVAVPSFSADAAGASA